MSCRHRSVGQTQWQTACVAGSGRASSLPHASTSTPPTSLTKRQAQPEPPVARLIAYSDDAVLWPDDKRISEHSWAGRLQSVPAFDSDDVLDTAAIATMPARYACLPCCRSAGDEQRLTFVTSVTASSLDGLPAEADRLAIRADAPPTTLTHDLAARAATRTRVAVKTNYTCHWPDEISGTKTTPLV